MDRTIVCVRNPNWSHSTLWKGCERPTLNFCDVCLKKSSDSWRLFLESTPRLVFYVFLRTNHIGFPKVRWKNTSLRWIHITSWNPSSDEYTCKGFSVFKLNSWVELIRMVRTKYCFLRLSTRMDVSSPLYFSHLITNTCLLRRIVLYFDVTFNNKLNVWLRKTIWHRWNI